MTVWSMHPVSMHILGIWLCWQQAALVAIPLGREFSVGHLEAHAVFMNAEIGYGFFITEVIGDFPKEEARQFAEYALGDAGMSSLLTDDDWHRVYEVKHGSRQRAATAIVPFHTASDQQ